MIVGKSVGLPVGGGVGLIETGSDDGVIEGSNVDVEVGISDTEKSRALTGEEDGTSEEDGWSEIGIKPSWTSISCKDSNTAFFSLSSIRNLALPPWL